MLLCFLTAYCCFVVYNHLLFSACIHVVTIQSCFSSQSPSGTDTASSTAGDVEQVKAVAQAEPVESVHLGSGTSGYHAVKRSAPLDSAGLPPKKRRKDGDVLPMSSALQKYVPLRFLLWIFNEMVAVEITDTTSLFQVHTVQSVGL